MKNNNPLVIPRNHKVEEALEAAEHNDMMPLNNLLKILTKPYIKQNETINFQSPSISGEKYQTFCGT